MHSVLFSLKIIIILKRPQYNQVDISYRLFISEPEPVSSALVGGVVGGIATLLLVIVIILLVMNVALLTRLSKGRTNTPGR